MRGDDEVRLEIAAQARRQLVRDGFLYEFEVNGKHAVGLTEKGRREAERLAREDESQEAR